MFHSYFVIKQILKWCPVFFEPRALVRPWCLSPAPSSLCPPATAGRLPRPPPEQRHTHGHLATRWWCPQRASLETQIKPVYFHIGDQNILCRICIVQQHECKGGCAVIFVTNTIWRWKLWSTVSHSDRQIPPHGEIWGKSCALYLVGR